MTAPDPSGVPQKSRVPSQQVPLVSIGVATHDAEQFVADTLRSLLEQTYPNLDIHVHDNGSSDRTTEIVEEVCADDPRVRMTRWQDDRGAVANFNHLLETAEGTYFMWASDHDLWDPRYVEVLAGALEGDHRAVLAYGETVLIDESGSELGLMDDLVDLSAPGARQRYGELIWRIGPCNMAYGLMRLDAARSTWGVLPILGPDNLLLAQMALRGSFVRVGSPLFFRRQNRPVEADPETERAQQLERLHGASQEYGSPSRVAAMTELRDQHLRLVHGEFSGFDRLLADLTTRHAFLDRLGVPDLLGSALHLRHRVTGRLRRWQRQLSP